MEQFFIEVGFSSEYVGALRKADTMLGAWWEKYDNCWEELRRLKNRCVEFLRACHSTVLQIPHPPISTVQGL